MCAQSSPFWDLQRDFCTGSGVNDFVRTYTFRMKSTESFIHEDPGHFLSPPKGFNTMLRILFYK